MRCRGYYQHIAVILIVLCCANVTIVQAKSKTFLYEGMISSNSKYNETTGCITAVQIKHNKLFVTGTLVERNGKYDQSSYMLLSNKKRTFKLTGKTKYHLTGAGEDVSPTVPKKEFVKTLTQNGEGLVQGVWLSLKVKNGKVKVVNLGT